MSDDNDNPQPTAQPLDANTKRITLTLSLVPWHLAIDAQADNVDQIIAMLQQATRHFEGIQRLQTLQQLQQQAQNEALTRQVSAAIRRGN